MLSCLSPSLQCCMALSGLGARLLPSQPPGGTLLDAPGRCINPSCPRGLSSLDWAWHLEGWPSSCQWAGGASWRKERGEPWEPVERAGGSPPGGGVQVSLPGCSINPSEAGSLLFPEWDPASPERLLLEQKAWI